MEDIRREHCWCGNSTLPPARCVFLDVHMLFFRAHFFLHLQSMGSDEGVVQLFDKVWSRCTGLDGHMLRPSGRYNRVSDLLVHIFRHLVSATLC